ncbi:porin family protein [Pseudochryseolinea flava]|uniref:Outer membrane protein beta-barrel domain-containing protein n=1 Tax=Pseudochryseolinea flava TaxID=2059302 RepID=A0A364XWT0_9BACT|nr:porin family protein [Pseudochryseolinea flava]RAV97987.1 hypothetical protein DQQ10_25630 [Pseudochryseolinea flava]
MQRLRIAFLVCFAIFCARGLKAQSQEECEQVLNRAIEEFNAGHFYGIPSMLHDCLERNQRAAWRQRAYILLAETYLLLDDPVGAERSYLEILRANPEFVPDRNRDPIDLVYLGSKFTGEPIFSLYGRIGANVSPVNLLKTRSALAGDVTHDYKWRTGIGAGVGAQYHYDQNFGVTLELNYMFTAYQYETTRAFGRDKLSVFDRQNWFKIPVTFRYSDSEGKYRPFGYIGYSVDMLFRDRGTLTFDDRNFTDGRIVPDERESPVINFNPKRNKINQALLFGGGVKYKLGLDYAFVDVRYSIGLTNVVKVENTINSADTEDPVFQWGYVDNLYKINNLSVSIGYIYPLYKPRKLKKARSKSVLKRIKKQDDEVTQD